MSDYTINDVKAAAERVKAACPDVILDRTGDYGFKLVGYKPGPREVLVLFQPARDDIGQREIITDIDAAIQLWSAQS